MRKLPSIEERTRQEVYRTLQYLREHLPSYTFAPVYKTGPNLGETPTKWIGTSERPDLLAVSVNFGRYKKL